MSRNLAGLIILAVIMTLLPGYTPAWAAWPSAVFAALLWQTVFFRETWWRAR